MSKFGTVARLVAVLTVLLAVSGRQSGVFAQDPAETPVVEETPPASYYVGVSCWPVGDGSLSACSFTASASDGSAIEALWVPAWVACAEVVDSGGASWTGDGYHVLSNSLTLTLVGLVSPAGGAGYMVRVNGNSVEAGGDGLACSPAPVAEEPEDTTGEPPVSTPDDTTDGGTTDEGTTDEGTTDEGTTDEGPPVAEIPDEATPDTGEEGNGTSGEAPVAEEGGDDGSTPDETGDGIVGDGSGDSAPVAAAQEEPAAEEVQAAAQVNISVIVYNCDEDPGADNPADVCTEDSTVPLTATDNGADLGAPADCGGVRCFAATVGNTFVVTEDISGLPLTYEPIGDISETIDPVEEDATIIFVNVAEDQQGDPQLGRVQIILGQCPSTEDKDTKYTIIEPDTFQARASEESCGPVAGAFLSISGGNIDGTIQGVTDGDGEWRGFLPPGDDYTVSGSFGTSPAFLIVTDEVTAIVIIDYRVGVKGTLNVTHTLCNIGDAAGTEITVSSSQPSNSGEGCGPSNRQFTIEEDGGDSFDFSLGNDGVATMSLPVGDYHITDLSSGESADLEITDGATTYVGVRTVELIGRLVVRHYYCSDPASSQEDPADGNYWREECDEPQSTELTLYDGGGDEIDSRHGKVFTWSELEAGNYSVSGGDFCATIKGYSDASGGFDVTPNVTTRIYVYTCADTGNGNGNGGDDDDDDDGGNNGGDDDDDDNGNGSDDDDDDGNADDDDTGNGNADDDADDDDADDDTDNGNTDDDENDDEEVAGVTTLPETGAFASTSNGSNVDELALLALALPALLAGAALARRRLN
jgi:hypothetical protein